MPVVKLAAAMCIVLPYIRATSLWVSWPLTAEYHRE
jgi:hypothetical protein